MAGIRLAEQALELRFGDAIEAIGAFFKSVAVHNRDSAARRRDQAPALEMAKGNRHAGAADAQHQSQEIMREVELIAFEPVMRHQQPARAALFNGTVSVGKRSVTVLHAKHMREMKKASVQGRALVKRLAQIIGRNA